MPRFFFAKNAVNLVEAVQGVARCVSLQGNGTCFRKGVTSIATNYHVVQAVLDHSQNKNVIFVDELNIEASMDIVKFYFTNVGSQWKKSYPTLLNYEYNGTVKSEAFEKHIRIDPLLGVENGFDYPDYCFASLNHPLKSYVLFVPSIRVGQIGEIIATISFPGLEGMERTDIHATRYQNSLTSVFPMVKHLMGGFGKRAVSYGRIFSPFKLNKGELWVDDRARKFTIDNQCLLSNECLLNGSSGRPVLLNGFQTKSSVDRSGNKWIFVEYAAVYLGGEYVPCMECLSANPTYCRCYRNLNDLVDFAHCSTCRDNPDERPSIVYIYALAVNHPSIVESYRVLVKSLVQTFDFDQLDMFKEYFQHHQIDFE